ncbi:MAG TPA: hypothetical protein VMY42_14710, partial [Thermoguttaceae bacterium]|nr:hypothetical protein [Thermoguttaceae bacterium]
GLAAEVGTGSGRIALLAPGSITTDAPEGILRSTQAGSGSLALSAGGSIGTASAALKTDVAAVAAELSDPNAPGGIFLQQTAGGVHGQLSIATVTGADGLSIDGIAVPAAQPIQITVNSGDLRVDRRIVTDGGKIDVLSSGSIEMADGALIDAGNGIIAVEAGGNITLGSVRTNSASQTALTITSTSGGVVDGGDAATDIVVPNGSVVIHTVAGVGSSGAIETDVASLDIHDAGSGGVRISESNAVTVLEIDAGSGPISLWADGEIRIGRLLTTNNTDDAVSVVSANGDITDGGDSLGLSDIEARAGRATLTAVNGSIGRGANGPLETSVASLVATAGGAAGLDLENDVSLAAILRADSGEARLNVVGAGNTLQTAGAWSADRFVVEVAGGLTILHAIDTDTAEGIQLRTTAGGDIRVNALMTAGGGCVTLISAGQIIDGNDAAGPVEENNVSAAELVMSAAGGIGLTDGGRLETSVGRLEATGGSGGVFVHNTGDLVIGEIAGSPLALVGISATGAPIDVSADGDLTIGEAITSVGGAIRLDSTIGNIVDNHVGTHDVTAGSLLLKAAGSIGFFDAAPVDPANPAHNPLETQVGTLAIEAGSSDADHVMLKNTGDLRLDAVGGVNSVSTAGGRIDLEVLSGSLTVGGTVGPQAVARVFSGRGPGGAVGSVEGGRITLRSSGSLLVERGALISSESGLGGNFFLSGVELQGEVALGRSDVTLAGGALDTIIAGDQHIHGNYIVGALRDIIVTADVTTEPNGISPGDVQFTAGRNVVVNAEVVSGGGAVHLLAGQDVTFGPGGRVASAGGAVLVAADADGTAGIGGGALTMSDGSGIDAGSGTIHLTAAGDVTLAGLQGRTLTATSTHGAIANTFSATIAVTDEAAFNAALAITLGDHGNSDTVDFGSLQLVGGDVMVFEDSATLLTGAHAGGMLAITSADNIVIDSGLVRAEGALALNAAGDLFVNDSLPPGTSEVVGGTIDVTAGGMIHIENGAVLESTAGGTIGKVTNAPPLLRIGEADPNKALTPSDRVQELKGTVGGIESEGDHLEQGANFTVTVVWDDGVTSVFTGIHAGESWEMHVAENGSAVASRVDAGIGTGPAHLLLTREYPNTHLSTVNLNVTAQVEAANDPNIRLNDSRQIDLNRVDSSVSTRVTGNEFGRVALAVERDGAVVVAPPEPIVAPPEIRIPSQQTNRIEEIRPPRETVVEEGRELYIVKVLPDGTEVDKQILSEDALADTEALFEKFRKKGLPDGHYRIYLKEVGFPARKLMEFYKSGDTFGEPVREPGRGSKPVSEEGARLRREQNSTAEATAWRQPADTPAVSADGDEDSRVDENSTVDEYSADVFESPDLLRRLWLGAALPAGTVLAARVKRVRWANRIDRAMEDSRDNSFTKVSRLRRRFRSGGK